MKHALAVIPVNAATVARVNHGPGDGTGIAIDLSGQIGVRKSGKPNPIKVDC
jgi:hypothetical protein